MMPYVMPPQQKKEGSVTDALWALLRSKTLAENCDMMVVYIKRDYGGAYKCYKHAQELGVQIMNIAEWIEKIGKICYNINN